MHVYNAKDQLDAKVKEELESYLNKLPAGDKEAGWKRIEKELYASETVPLRRISRIKWQRQVAAAAVFLLVIGVFSQTQVGARAYRILKEASLDLQGSLRNFVTVIAPEGRGGIDEPDPDKPVHNDLTSKDLTRLASTLPFTPLVVPENSKEWTLTAVRVENEGSINARLLLQYKNKAGKMITFTGEAITSTQSKTLFYDEEDAQLKKYRIRGLTVKILTYKNGFTHAWWVENDLSLTVIGPILAEEMIDFIKLVEPYSGG